MRKPILSVAAAGLLLWNAGCSDGTHPESARATLEQQIAEPPAAVYAELDADFTEVEAAAKAGKPITADTKQPIVFVVEREPGHRLRLEATSGFREPRIVHAFVESGATPNETKLRVYFDPPTLKDAGYSNDANVIVATFLAQVRSEIDSPSGEVKTLFVFTPSPRGKSGFAECC